ncbi:Na(+)/H(+) exchange regulatory cofactor NHE-RF3 isoform X1 [Tachysurus vachellii]|nr:Na(+)/H(+) exchange regulatory cofactor NHE-RF3 isoform X1 [Tachysurus vachellii]
MRIMAGPKPRVIALSKHEGQTYGFYLRAEEGIEGHLVRALEMGGPAELAGLKDGDRIIRVNGIFVDNLEHLQVADLVKKSGLTVTFHVLGDEAYRHAKSNGINLAEPQSPSAQSQPTMNGVSAPGPKLKLCFLQKSSNGFGFSVKSFKGEEGIFMTDLIAGGIADNAGVKAHDRVVEINGENIERATHDQTVEKVKAAGKSVMLLLVDEDTDKYYKNKGIALGAGLATTKYLPLKPRIAEITRGADGYGFFLKADPETPGHFIGDIDRESPAEKGGLKEMDQLVAVDGEEVIHCTHDQVVDKIRQCGNRCCLLVVDVETDKMYKMGGISPLLYWEETRSSPPQQSNPEPEPNVTPVPAVPDAAEKIYKPKLCRMEKTAAGYGFHLNGIQGVHGQYIKEVVKGGAAERAGLEDDDILVEVNGVNTEQSTHEEAVNLIRSSGDTLVLLVAEKDAYDHLKAKGIAITPKLLDTENTPAESRERTPSVSSTSSSDSDDARL